VEDTRSAGPRRLQPLDGQYEADIVMLQQDTCTQKYALFGFDCGLKMNPEKIYTCHTGDSVPPGRVVLQTDASFIPKESLHNLPCR
jgi:hypothetical protein